MENEKALLRAKLNVSIKNDNTFKIGNLKIVRKCEMISYVKFKARINEMLNL